MTRDIFDLTRYPDSYNQCIDAIVEYIRENHGTSVDAIVAPDTKGFVVATNVASKLKLPFIPIRKKGKLSGEVIRISFKNRMNKVNTCREIHHRFLLRLPRTLCNARRLSVCLSVCLFAYLFVC